jgi:hypothetical protein
MPWDDWRDTKAKTYETLTVSSMPQGLDPNKYANYTNAVISVDNGDIRYRIDGGDPTRTDGHAVRNGQVFYLTSFWDIQNFLAVRATSTDAVLHVTYSVTV